MSSARRIAFGRQIDRREIARNPREARANMEVVDLAARRKAEAEDARQAAEAEEPEAIEDQPAMAEDVQQVAAEQQDKEDEGPAAETEKSSHVRIRYEGAASRFRIAGYVFKAGDVLAIARKDADEILTYPYERFSLVKE